MTDYPDTAIATSATTLLHYLEGFGDKIAQQNQLSKNNILTNITDGFTKNTTRNAALAAMHGTLWITTLQTVNNNYAT